MVPSVQFPLTSAWSKLARADEHLQSLHREIRAFLGTNPYAFGISLDMEQSRSVFSTLLVTPPPTRLGPVFGDYIHNLRCALDHLAWRFAQVKYSGVIPEDAERQIQYPIGKDLAAFRSQAVMAHLTHAQIAFMERFQPKQHRPDDLLFLLRELSNADKHRVMHPIAVSVANQTPEFVGNEDAVIREIFYEAGKPLVEEAEFATVTFEQTGPDPHVEMRGLPVVLSFGAVPDHALRPMQNLVTQILNEATESALW
jgi:hypothetical protein